MSRERIENTFGLRLLFGEWIEGKKVRKQSTPVCIFLFFHRAHDDENNNNNDDDSKATHAKSNRVAKKNKNICSCCVRICLILIWIEQKVDKPTAITAFFSANFSICFFMFFLFFKIYSLNYVCVRIETMWVMVLWFESCIFIGRDATNSCVPRLRS